MSVSKWGMSYRRIRTLMALKAHCRKFMLEGSPDAVAEDLFDWATLAMPEVFSGYSVGRHHWSVGVVLILEDGLLRHRDKDPMLSAALHGALGDALMRARKLVTSSYEVSLMEGAIHLFALEDLLRQRRMNI